MFHAIDYGRGPWLPFLVLLPAHIDNRSLACGIDDGEASGISGQKVGCDVCYDITVRRCLLRKDEFRRFIAARMCLTDVRLEACDQILTLIQKFCGADVRSVR